MKKSDAKERFSPTPAQQAAFGVEPYCTKKREVQFASALIGDRNWNFGRMRKALLRLIEQNESLRVRFDKDKKELCWSVSETAMLPPIFIETFSTKDEQDAFFARVAPIPLKLHKGETMQVILFHAFNGKRGIFIKAFAPLLDLNGMLALDRELLRLYAETDAKAGEDGPVPFPAPDTEADEDAAAADIEFFTELLGADGGPVYAGLHGDELLRKARKKRPDARVPAAYDSAHDEARMLTRELPPETAAALFAYANEKRISVFSAVDLCLRISGHV